MTKEQNLIKALKCLYLELPPEIVIDVRAKVFDYVQELQEEINHLKEEVNHLKTDLKYHEERAHEDRV